MDNKYTGEVILDIQGKPHTLVFDWSALALLKSKFTVDEIARILKTQEPENVAFMLHCALKKHHPEMTPEKILNISPPFVTTLQALDTAITYAYFGPRDAKDVAAEAEPADTKKKKKSKTR